MDLTPAAPGMGGTADMFEIRADGPIPGEPGGPAAGANGNGELALRPYGAPTTLPAYGTHAPPPTRRPFSPRMLLRFKAMIALIAVLGAAATIPPIWMFTQLKYYANAYVQIKPTTQRQIYKLEENSMLPQYQQFVNTNVALIRSPAVLNAVLDLKAVQDTDWYNEPSKSLLGGAPKNVYERLVDDLRVTNLRNTELIEIGFSAPTPKDADVVVREILDTYIEGVKVKSEQQSQDLVGRLLQQETDIGIKLSDLITERGAFTSIHGSASLEELQTSLNNEKLKLEAQVYELEVTKRMTSWEMLEVQKQHGLGVDAPTQGSDKGGSGEFAKGRWPRLKWGWLYQVADVVRFAEKQGGDSGVAVSASNEGGLEAPRRLFWSDREWSRLYQDYEARNFALEQQKATSNMGDSHPQMKQLRSARDLSLAKLKEREQQLLAGGDAAVLAAAIADKSIDPKTRLKELQYVLDRTEQENNILNEAMKRQTDRIEKVGTDAAKLRWMDQEIDQITGKHKAVQERIAQVQSELLTEAAGRIVKAGDVRVSSKPQNDRRLLFSLAAILGWFGLALGISYLRGMSDPSMSNAGDVTGTVHIPFLGQMPRFAPGTDALSDTSPMLLESIRMIRTALLERCVGRQGFTVLITSPNTGSGKTTFSMLLARSLGHMGKRVLLVDTDLRRGSLTERLGIGGEVGLVDLLRNKTTSPVEVAQFSERIGADVIPTGRRATVDDAERMANGRFSTSLKEWRAKYDFVILDAAPVLPVADARILAGQTDGTIMAVRASQTRRDEALEALAELSAAGAKLFGTVLIGTDPRSGYYRGYDYGSLARREESATV